MNQKLQDYARSELKKGLANCTDGQREKFKLMYSHKDLTLPIDEVVDRMPEDNLDWAMQQVDRTLQKNSRQ
ncbi:MAG: hypothetical protein JAY60_18610 [Candidatus Thiodiazotropha weberae]|nr:hypothetical protein [Candidatus Thiodiazotropha weberae]